MGESRVRANYVKYAIVRVKALPAPQRDAVFDVLGATRSEIRAAGLLAWMPMRVYADLIDATRTALGSRGSRQFWRDMMTSSFERQLLKPLLDGALRLYGRTPASLLRRAPQAWSLVSRDGGKIHVEGDHQLHFEELPFILRRSPAIVDAMAGMYEATFAYLDRPCNVTAHAEELVHGRMWLEAP